MNYPVLLEILISRRNIPPGIGVAGAAGQVFDWSKCP
jgi:hypothetical protein